MASAIPPHFDYTGRAGSSAAVPRRRAWQHTGANGNQTASRSSSPFDFLLQSSNAPRVAEQRRARQLLFHGFSALQNEANAPSSNDPEIIELRKLLSAETEIFVPDEVQKEIYGNDTGTAMVPRLLKRLLVDIKFSFIVRPVTIEDARRFVEWAYQHKVHYTIRGAGTWPFGGCIPVEGAKILDLSYLDFVEVETATQMITVGPGVLFPTLRKMLKEHGLALRQDITNPNSGTLCGWIVTGGLGIGAYKYGPVKNSVAALLIITPRGELKALHKDDEEFDLFFGSEGQLGIVVGALVRVKKDETASKPFGLVLPTREAAQDFIQLVAHANLQPSSIIYFDREFVKLTVEIEREHLEAAAHRALERNDVERSQEAREDLQMLHGLGEPDHVLVLNFDTAEDYEVAVRSRLFGTSGANLRHGQLSYRQLPTALAHMFWEHRYKPVQMKQKGPSMLVSETVIPLAVFPRYMQLLRRTLRALLDLEIKTEGHMINKEEMLIQSLLLADTKTLRHKLYFALVPYMTQMALHFGAKPYGIGIWNLPFLRAFKKAFPEKSAKMAALKGRSDEHKLINRGKFLNAGRQRLVARLAFNTMSRVQAWVIKLLDQRAEDPQRYLKSPLSGAIWKIGTLLFPQVVPSKLKAERHPLAEITSVCAECDSCERVCPTSDVFGLLGPATPVTRRKTANRLAAGEEISQAEALGFLVCTRCDNCTRVCPTDIPLTKLYDLVEADQNFIRALSLGKQQKTEFIDRFWQIMKESRQYLPHTLAQQKEEKSHLQHGLKVIYPRGYEYGRLFIDPDTCIRCGMCSHENACTYGARLGHPREIPELLHLNCALCNACVNYCPQNKAAQMERESLDRVIHQAVDLEEKKFWINRQRRIHDTTVVQRSTQVTEMSDLYVTEQIIMEIDKEASTGQIPVSGMGQGDRHMGIGFDAERFSHFHIVGPAQNRLHEGDPDEELSVILGKREDFCKFDGDGRIVHGNGDAERTGPRRLKLRTPIMYNVIEQLCNGKIELALMKVAEKQGSLVVMYTRSVLDYYEYFLREGYYQRLPAVIMPRVDHELMHRLTVNPNTNREFLMDFWRMPAFELKHDANINRTLQFIRDSAHNAAGQQPLISGYLEISEYDLVGINMLTPAIKQKVNEFLDLGVDILHVHGLRNKDEYFVTSTAVQALHHYLLRIGMRHEVSIIASGGMRLASDTQKTIQRGAEATLIDFAALLALDPTAYRAYIENRATTERLLSMEVDWAVKRLNNQAESRKVQILEVLGAAGFKDIKKTVGEEGRLIDFHQLENRLQRDIFEKEDAIAQYAELNQELMASEPIPQAQQRTYSSLREMIRPLPQPHNFYRLDETNQNLLKRDYVWPGSLIESMGRMAAGDTAMLDLRHVKATGALGDGFDVMRILYNKDPMDIPESDLEDINTSLRLSQDLILAGPWMFGGKSVGSIGLDTWRAHVIACRALGTQCDTGEGGYPTSFFLNAKGEPIFFTENEVQEIKRFFESGRDYTIAEMRETLLQNGCNAETHPHIFAQFDLYPSLASFHFMTVIDSEDEAFISTELKTGLFGVTKETMKKARRIVIAYSQGAKMGIGGHILAKKVNKLVSYLRGIEGLEELNLEGLEALAQRLARIQNEKEHPLRALTQPALAEIDQARAEKQVTAELRRRLREIREAIYNLHAGNRLDELEFENLLRESQNVIEYVYTSIISPFPFHNCYSIEDVKAFIDVVRMINPDAVVSIKVSPSIDIEFIAAGLGRIGRDNTEEIVNAKFGPDASGQVGYSEMAAAVAEYARKYGMKIEVWLDGPRGGTGASPNIIKGQMGMHIEYAVPLIHNRLVRDGLRNHVNFFVSGGIRTYEDVIKAVALGADGVIWGTAPLVAIGCDRNRNCQDGCSRGIATSNLIMQKLRDVELNALQMVNTFAIVQMQVMRALAALGCKDIRELRGRHDKLHWIGLKERVDHRARMHKEIAKEVERDEDKQRQRAERQIARAGQSNCGVAAVNGTAPIPSYILDETLACMKNRGMDGVGVAKALCFPRHPDDYAYRVMVKGALHKEMEENLALQWQAEGRSSFTAELRAAARELVLRRRAKLMNSIYLVFLEPCFDFKEPHEAALVRERYKCDENGNERDYREFGNDNTDPGDLYTFFVRVKPEVLQRYIQEVLLAGDSPSGGSHLHMRTRFLRGMFSTVTPETYRYSPKFMQKAEDLFVLQHASELTRVLYASEVPLEQLEKFVQNNGPAGNGHALFDVETVVENAMEEPEPYLRLMHEFVQAYPFAQFEHRYKERRTRLAAVMSCGKNFATWKTAGREVPWQTPSAPNNIIHVRLATGSVVEQMNSHPFSNLHTALTHNGETTNYEALKQRIEFFGLSPLATTDTAVAALKFHLTADEWEYPDWALFESFSPTTGDDLHLVDPALRPQLEEVQRVEFASSPDGPYQYLCLRHNPYTKVTERVDLKDPADLRPNVSAFWIDKSNPAAAGRAFSIISSEEQAVHRMLQLLDREGLVDGGVPDLTWVSGGMISRYEFDEQQRIQSFEFIDRYGQPIVPEDFGTHYSCVREKLHDPPAAIRAQLRSSEFINCSAAEFGRHLALWDFNTYRWVLTRLVDEAVNPGEGGRAAPFNSARNDSAQANLTQFTGVLHLLTWLNDYMRTLDTGGKAKSSLLDITRRELNRLLDYTVQGFVAAHVHVNRKKVQQFSQKPAREKETLVIDASGFLAEGTDPEFCLAAFLRQAYELGWRRYILYRVSGQRLISTAVMGKRDTDDVEMDVYGAAGEYFGAFMQGGVIRLHGNAQNFCAMCMHHGYLYIFGNAGKVCGYASKGGKVFILGNVVDRAWTNSVDDVRCQKLEVMILGSASKFAGESLMGGDFCFGGLHFDAAGKLCTNDRPYLGTKLLGGASRGNFFFFDPKNRLEPVQYAHGILKEISHQDWERGLAKFKEILQLSNVAVTMKDGKEFIEVDGKQVEFSQENFKLIVPRGGLKGYESH
jgi:glutamate synthase domain-containing protein 2/FAD/FMN-containing dehydrogenase/glutamate synthase domain-containing protein 3/ferredoxin